MRRVTCVPQGLSAWRTAAIAIVVLAGSTNCNSDATPFESSRISTTPPAESATETSQPLVESPDVEGERSLASPTGPFVVLTDPVLATETPPTSPTMPSTSQPSEIGEAFSPNDEERNGAAYRSLFTIPVLDNSYLVVGELQGEPFDRSGPMPERIVATTDKCSLVSVDSLAGEIAPIWDYPNVRIENLYDDSPNRMNAAEVELSPAFETVCDYIVDLEWVNPSFLLISLCCEPAVGRFELIDISNSNRPHSFGISGGSPSVNDQDVLLYSIPHGFRTSVNVIGSIPWNLQSQQADSGSVSFDLESHHTFYALAFSPENELDISGFVSELSWVGDSKVAFELWTIGLYPDLYPFIGIIDIPSRSITFNSSGVGWTMPAGDTNGNLVVAEQQCTRNVPDSCNTPEAKIVVLDPDSLTPVHEVSVNDNIADMDLSRGWLLVTFSNGQTGTLDLADGTFTAIADGIVNAGWME